MLNRVPVFCRHRSESTERLSRSGERAQTVRMEKRGKRLNTLKGYSIKMLNAATLTQLVARWLPGYFQAVAM